MIQNMQNCLLVKFKFWKEEKFIFFAIVTEYAEKGSSMPKRTSVSPLEESKARKYFIDLIQGLIYCKRSFYCVILNLDSAFL